MRISMSVALNEKGRRSQSWAPSRPLVSLDWERPASGRHARMTLAPYDFGDATLINAEKGCDLVLVQLAKLDKVLRVRSHRLGDLGGTRTLHLHVPFLGKCDEAG